MHILALDDAQLLMQLNRNRELSVMDDIFCNVRKGHIHIFGCVHSPASIGPGMLANSSNKIVTQLTAGQDREAMCRNMGITDKKEKDYFSKLNNDKHEVIVEFAKRARPFVARIKEVTLEKPMTKEELYRNNERIIPSFSKPVLRTPEEPKPKKSDELDDDTKSWLMAVYLRQYKDSVTEIHQTLGFSGYRGTKVTKFLETNGYIKIIEIIKGRGLSKYPILLEPAYKILNLPEKKFYGKGAGYEHIVWQHLLAEHFADYKPVVELNKNNKFIDVVIKQYDKLIGIEVAMTSVNEKVNIIKDIQQAGVDFIIVGCKDVKVLREVKSIVSSLDENLRQKVAVYLLSEILKKDLEELINRE